MDDDNRKFIPGLESLFTLCLGDERAKDMIHMAGSFLKTSVKLIEMIMDIMFVILVFVVCVIGKKGVIFMYLYVYSNIYLHIHDHGYYIGDSCFYNVCYR
jgi:hypothetical protein